MRAPSKLFRTGPPPFKAFCLNLKVIIALKLLGLQGARDALFTHLFPL